jgi:tetratricopeptide (TPR) repeat protein
MVEAQVCFDNALQSDPAFAGGYVGRGDILLQRGRYREAFIEYDKALRLNPELKGALEVNMERARTGNTR